MQNIHSDRDGGRIPRAFFREALVMALEAVKRRGEAVVRTRSELSASRLKSAALATKHRRPRRNCNS